MTEKELQIKAEFAKAIAVEIIKQDSLDVDVVERTISITNEIFDGICPSPPIPDHNHIVHTKIKDSGLSNRTINCLLSANIETIGDLIKSKKSDLLRLRNFGKKSLQEIEIYLYDNDISFEK